MIVLISILLGGIVGIIIGGVIIKYKLRKGDPE